MAPFPPSEQIDMNKAMQVSFTNLGKFWKKYNYFHVYVLKFLGRDNIILIDCSMYNNKWTTCIISNASNNSAI